MATIKERYVTDETGQPVGVLLELDDYRRLLDQLEELESIRAYDAAKTSSETPVPFDEALADLEGDDPRRTRSRSFRERSRN